MRIAFDNQTFCQQSYGGISRYFVRLTEKLLSCGQDVAIFAPLHQNQYVNQLPPGIVHGHSVKRYPPKSTIVLTTLNQIAASMQIKRWRPNLVHETYYSRLSSSPPSCPTVVTVHDMIHELFKHEFPGNDRTAELKRLAIERADHVICVSENTRNDLLNHFKIDINKVSVVHHGFERFDNNSLSTSHDLTSCKPYLLYIGNRGGYKNFKGFLHAVASSINLKADFDIVAFGGGALTAKEVSVIAELGFLPEQVRQTSGNDNTLAKLYEHASAFVYPSHYEGFGMPPLEAMAHKCPVISSNTSSMPEVIGDAAEYFDPSSIQSITAAIEAVVYSSSRTQDLLARGIQRIQHFSWQRCAESTLEIYQKLAGFK